MNGNCISLFLFEMIFSLARADPSLSLNMIYFMFTSATMSDIICSLFLLWINEKLFLILILDLLYLTSEDFILLNKYIYIYSFQLHSKTKFLIFNWKNSWFYKIFSKNNIFYN